MFCPRCSAQATDDTKFCKQCGANLFGVRDAMVARGEKFDWTKTWVADMVLTREELERRRGITPEKKRNNEIRTGIITCAAGIGGMIFLRYLMEAIAHQNGGTEAEILTRIWLAGLIPFLVGIAMIFNAVVIGGREVKMEKTQVQTPPPSIPLPVHIDAKTTDQLSPPADFSITEHTTAHLPEHVPVPSRRE